MPSWRLPTKHSKIHSKMHSKFVLQTISLHEVNSRWICETFDAHNARVCCLLNSHSNTAWHRRRVRASMSLSSRCHRGLHLCLCLCLCLCPCLCLCLFLCLTPSVNGNMASNAACRPIRCISSSSNILPLPAYRRFPLFSLHLPRICSLLFRLYIRSSRSQSFSVSIQAIPEI